MPSPRHSFYFLLVSFLAPALRTFIDGDIHEDGVERERWANGNGNGVEVARVTSKEG